MYATALSSLRKGGKTHRLFGPPLILLLLTMLVSGALPPSRSVSAAGGLSLPSGFVDEIVVPGLLSPRDFAFTPDGRILIAERGSAASADINFASIRVFKNGALLPNRAVTLNVCGDGERGLLGLALDPAFASNGYLYVYYTRQATSGAVCAYGTYSAGQLGPRNRISRLTMSGDTINLASEVVLIDNIATDSGIHNAGDLHFGADGYLYASVGDSNLSSPIPPSTVPMAQDLSRLGGKILRIKPQDGAPNGYLTTGNPFDTAQNAWRCGLPANLPGSSTGPCKEIFAYGLRNPFRFTIQPGTSSPFVGDVGGGAWEEIDDIISGGNYGYPMREGPCPGGNVCIPPQPPVAGLIDPIYYYPHTVIGANVDSAVIVGAFYTGSSYPSIYLNNLFFADFVRGFIRRLAYDSGTQTWNAASPDFATNGVGIIGLQAGPNGDLYYLSFPTDQSAVSELRRIRYNPGVNLPPVAVAAATPIPAQPTMTYSFSSAGSYDPNNSPITFAWNFGDTTTSTAQNPSHTYQTSGVKTVTLTVTDNTNLTSTPATIQVFPGNTPASASIVLANLTTPARNNAYYAGDTWQFNATNFTDDQTIPPNPYTWEVVFHHRSHTHPFLSGLSGSSGQFSIPTIGETDPLVWYEVVLHVTDAQGQVSTFSQNLNPAIVTLNFNTSPGGGQLILDGSAITTPYSITRVVGLQTGIQAPSPQSINNIPITFIKWSNGAAQSFTFNTPSTDLTLRAFYQAPFTRWLPVISRSP